MPATATLDAMRVQTIFFDCMLGPGERTGYVTAEGITTKACFNSKRLEEHRAEIEALLDELPETFKKRDRGASFLSACDDKHGKQWTGLHFVMERLFQLGLAIGKARLLKPRAEWCTLPGGMPFYIVN